MRDDYFNEALEIVGDPYVLVNLLWGRVRMLWSGSRPLIESPQKLPVEDVVLREIIEGRITYVHGDIVVLDALVGPEGAVIRKHAHRTRGNPTPSPLVNAPGNFVAAT